jgi:hypothetical protein
MPKKDFETNLRKMADEMNHESSHFFFEYYGLENSFENQPRRVFFLSANFIKNSKILPSFM